VHLVGFNYKTDFGSLTPEDGTDRLSRKVGKKLPLLAKVITQNSAVLISSAAEIIAVCSEIHTKTHKYTVWGAEHRIC